MDRRILVIDRKLQRDTNSGLNMVESWNGGNDIVFHGNRGRLTSNRQDERELSVLCLRILQASLVYVNTLMLQDILAEPGRLDRLTPADRRGLTPLFWSHVKAHGEILLDMDRRLQIA